MLQAARMWQVDIMYICFTLPVSVIMAISCLVFYSRQLELFVVIHHLAYWYSGCHNDGTPPCILVQWVPQRWYATLHAGTVGATTMVRHPAYWYSGCHNNDTPPCILVQWEPQHIQRPALASYLSLSICLKDREHITYSQLGWVNAIKCGVFYQGQCWYNSH